MINGFIQSESCILKHIGIEGFRSQLIGEFYNKFVWKPFPINFFISY